MWNNRSLFNAVEIIISVRFCNQYDLYLMLGNYLQSFNCYKYICQMHFF